MKNHPHLHLHLVARPLTRQNLSVSDHPTLAHRAHWALWCLERDARGDPPAISAVEAAAGTGNAILHKILKGATKRPTWETLRKLAPQLGTSPEWLMFDEGPAPRTDRTVPPYSPSLYRQPPRAPRKSQPFFSVPPPLAIQKK